MWRHIFVVLAALESATGAIAQVLGSQSKRITMTADKRTKGRPKGMNKHWNSVASIGLAGVIAGCGGGGGGIVRAPEEERVYAHIPIHGEVRSPFTELDRDWHVGGNVAPSDAMRETMSDIGVRGGAHARHGRVGDGASAAELAAYLGNLEEADQFIVRQEGRLRVLLPTDADATMREYATRAIRMVNAALPHNVRLTLDPVGVEDDGTLVKDDVERGTLVIVERPQEGNFSGLGGPTGQPGYEEWLADRPSTNETVEEYSRLLERGYSNGGWVEIDPKVLEPRRRKGASGTADWEERNALNTFVHELIHAMAIVGHPDRTRFTESVMSYGRGYDNPHIVYPMDYDVILATYAFIEPETRRVNVGPRQWRIERISKSERQLLEDLAGWDENSTHIFGELDLQGETVAFGARARNGMAQAWATGPRPYTVKGHTLQGSATWQGALLGMTPDEEAVAGDANLHIDLEALTGTLSFTAMEYWEARATPGGPGSGTQWGDGDLGYSVRAEDGTFRQTGGDDGIVTGTFFGPQYQGMGGVLEREDLAAGFGGTKM